MSLRAILFALAISASGAAPVGGRVARFTVGMVALKINRSTAASGAAPVLGPLAPAHAQLVRRIHKGARLPFRGSINWFSKEMHEAGAKFRYEIFQGENDNATDNQYLGAFEYELEASVAVGVPYIVVTVLLDIYGFLTVTAMEFATGRLHTLTLRPEEHFLWAVANATELCGAEGRLGRRLAKLERSGLVRSPSAFERLADMRAKLTDLRGRIAGGVDAIYDPRAIEVKTEELGASVRKLEEQLLSDTVEAAAAQCSEADARLAAWIASDMPRSALLEQVTQEMGGHVAAMRSSMSATASDSAPSVVEVAKLTEELHNATRNLDQLVFVFDYASRLSEGMGMPDACGAPAPLSAGHGADFDVFVAEVGRRTAALRARSIGEGEVEKEVRRMTEDMVEIFQRLAMQAVGAVATVTAANGERRGSEG